MTAKQVLFGETAHARHEPAVVVQRVVDGEGDDGYNAASGEYGDMVRRAAECRLDREPHPYDRLHDRPGIRQAERGNA